MMAMRCETRRGMCGERQETKKRMRNTMLVRVAGERVASDDVGGEHEVSDRARPHDGGAETEEWKKGGKIAWEANLQKTNLTGSKLPSMVGKDCVFTRCKS
jgi:hypothetical protein